MSASTDRVALERADWEAGAGVYRLLGRLWLREIDEPLLAELREGPLADAFSEIGGDAASLVGEDALQRLAVEYCALFIGPVGHLPPYQSVWTDGQFHGKSLDSMRHYLALIAGGPSENDAATPDHLGVQLLFLSTVLGDLARQSTDPPTTASLRLLATRFFTDHLTWPDRLFENLIARAPASFYGDLGRITRAFLQLEHQHWLTPEPESTNPARD